MPWDVATSTRPPQLDPRRPRSRFGYGPKWWGDDGKAGAERRSYWETTRRPAPSLVFVAPLLLVYEFAVLGVGGRSAEALRTGADSWMRQGLAACGVTDHWFLPLALLLTLLIWQVADKRDWRFPGSTLVGMALESLVLAVALVGLSKLVDIGFTHLERARAPVLAVGSAPSRETALLIGFLGAGVYEEALFRLLLVPVFFRALRGLQAPTVLAGTLAVTGSALLFSLAHHAGTPGEAFTWYAFIFRWLAGVYFAWVFVVRGFGVAVGTHTAYDVLVGWIGWHF